MSATGPDVATAENALIGAALIDPGVIDLVSTRADQFLRPVARIAWGAMIELHYDAKELDPVTIADMAPPGPREHLVGFLGKCAVDTPTAANAEYYADIVRKAYVSRRVMSALADVQDAARREAAAGEELLSMGLELLSAIDTDQPDAALSIGEIARARLAELEELAAAQQRGEKVVTGDC
jgi:replicative DNA helicase